MFLNPILCVRALQGLADEKHININSLKYVCPQRLSASVHTVRFEFVCEPIKGELVINIASYGVSHYTH